MAVGFIGAGNMAQALARGLGEPVLASDSGSGRAAALVVELGGEALDNAGVAAAADWVVLACKPYQLEAVAPALQHARRVVSLLGATPIDRVRAALPGAQVAKAMPNTPVEVRRGVTVLADESDLLAEARALFERVGKVFEMPERLMDVATGTVGVSPAYTAVIAEAQIDAAIKFGVKADLAAQIVVEGLRGSAELIEARGYDTLSVRREVTSPGGSTARGLQALEERGLRAAFGEALKAVLDR
jgi:pyrroline-5-carboxylate reductase